MEQQTISMFTDTVKYSGDTIFVKPFCDFFQINYENQCRVISKDGILKTESTKKSSKVLYGDERERYALSKKGFVRWIQLINPQIVQATFREKLEQYQSSIFDFLFGSLERDEEAKLKYARLAKLKRLRSRLTSEIARCEAEMKGYLKYRFSPDRLALTPKEGGAQ